MEPREEQSASARIRAAAVRLSEEGADVEEAPLAVQAQFHRETAAQREGLPAASACFLWIDEETGDELAVEVRGNEAFFNKLETIGFERQAGSDSLSDDEPSSIQLDDSSGSREVSAALIEESAPRKSRQGRLRARMDVGSSRKPAANSDSTDPPSGSWRERRGA